MGANFTEQASTRAARSLSTVVYTVELFDEMTCIHKQSTGHTVKSDVDDVLSIVIDVQSYQILTAINERDHKSFPAFSPNPLHGLKHTKLDKWIRQKVKLITLVTITYCWGHYTTCEMRIQYVKPYFIFLYYIF